MFRCSGWFGCLLDCQLLDWNILEVLRFLFFTLLHMPEVKSSFCQNSLQRHEHCLQFVKLETLDEICIHTLGKQIDLVM